MTENSLAPVRVVMRAGAPHTTTQVVFGLNRQFLWTGDRSLVLARGSFRGDPDFGRLEEAVRPLVFDLLGREENIDVVKLGFGTSHVEFMLAPSAAGDLETYVAQMRLLLAEAFDFDPTFNPKNDGTTTVYLVSEQFGPPGKNDRTTEAIMHGWGGSVRRVADDEVLAAHIRQAITNVRGI